MPTHALTHSRSNLPTYSTLSVRDYTINQLGEEALRAKQAEITQALLDARPEGGFPTAVHSTHATLEGYVARQLYWHMMGALTEGQAPPEDWITHKDQAVLRAVAVAVGYDGLVALADADEAGGECLRAARYVWCASKLGDEGKVNAEVRTDLLYRAVDLVALVPDAQRGEDTVRAFESEVLGGAWCRDFGTERHSKVIEQMAKLAAGGDATFASKCGEALESFVSQITLAWRVPKLHSAAPALLTTHHSHTTFLALSGGGVGCSGITCAARCES